MSAINTALESISTHPDIVAAYYVRSAGRWVVTGLSRTGDGAAVVNDVDGENLNVLGSKRDALKSINSN